MSKIISDQTQAILKFAAITTLLRGDVGWTIKDCILLSWIIDCHKDRLSDDWLRAELKKLGWGSPVAKRINQLKNEWYRSQDYAAAQKAGDAQ